MDFSSTKNYINRELSWLDFNSRVLEEAYDEHNPLLEKLKFLSITSSNLDEFFMVRVAGLKAQVAVNYTKKDPSGLTAIEQLKRISDKTHEMITKQYVVWHKLIMPQLEEQSIKICQYEAFTGKQKKYIDEYFEDIIFPILTPLAIDSSRPFPLLKNKSIYIAVHLKVNGQNKMGFVQLPTIFPRIIKVPSGLNSYSYIFSEDIICENIEKLFKGNIIVDYTLFRLTRNADLLFDEEDAQDLLIEIEKQIKLRKNGFPVRLEVAKGCSKYIKAFLIEAFSIIKDDLYHSDGPLDLTCLMKFAVSFSKQSNLQYKKNISSSPLEGTDLFDQISKHDLLLHHPYQSFNPIISLLQAASVDSQVLAIKQTLYRVSADSPIIKALMNAANNDKQVTVLVELKARFDEENNISWARKLEQAGCHVIYGLPNLKIHSKALLIIRKESSGIKRYMHFSTGNYNDRTAALYTDLGFFTTRENFASDISSLFNYLTGYTEKPVMKKLVTSPSYTRKFFNKRIDHEISNVKAGLKGEITFIMNSLVDPLIIQKLYEASSAGVKIDLIVRGICCLKPNIKKLSENITVRSIVGRYLEHTRVYYFYNNNKPLIYLGSADLMSRNLDRRVEVLFPVEDNRLIKQLQTVINLQMSDNQKARHMKSNGTYVYQNKREINSQEMLFDYYANLDKED